MILPTVDAVGFAWDVAAAAVHREEGCTVLLWQPAPCVIVTRVVGPGTLTCLQFYIDHAERAMRSGRLRVFHDWAGLTRYEPAARDLLKRWGAAHNADFVRVSYLVGSKVIAMLISVAAMSMGRELRATTDRRQFLADLDAALTP